MIFSIETHQYWYDNFDACLEIAKNNKLKDLPVTLMDHRALTLITVLESLMKNLDFYYVNHYSRNDIEIIAFILHHFFKRKSIKNGVIFNLVRLQVATSNFEQVTDSNR